MIELVVLVICMALMILFSFLIFFSLSSAADIRIRLDMKQLLRTYDKVIDNLSKEIQQLNEEKEKLEKVISHRSTPISGNFIEEEERVGMGAAVLPRTTTYRSVSLSDSYDAIRQNFRLTQGERNLLLDEIADDTKNQGRGEEAARLLEGLSFDSVFQLGKLSSETQLQILDESLEDRDWVLLRDYYEMHEEQPFDIIEFWNWLKELVDIESNDIYVRCGEEEISKAEGFDYHRQICEGIQIKTGNRLYDFSIKEREIS